MFTRFLEVKRPYFMSKISKSVFGIFLEMIFLMSSGWILHQTLTRMVLNKMVDDPYAKTAICCCFTL